jgi:hypothetical protein
MKRLMKILVVCTDYLVQNGQVRQLQGKIIQGSTPKLPNHHADGHFGNKNVYKEYLGNLVSGKNT